MSLKRIVLAFFVLILVLVGGVAVFLMTLDFNQYKGLIAETVEDATGRKLSIEGDIDLKLSLHPALAVERVTFANAVWGSRGSMVTLKRLDAQVSLLPLLSGEVNVKRLVLVEPDILLETDAKGRGNWLFDTEDEKEKEKPGKDDAAEAVLPAFHEVRIENASLTYRDGQTKAVTKLVLRDVTLKADSVTSPLAIALAGAYNGNPFQLDGTVGALSALDDDKPYPVALRAQAGGATVTLDGTIREPLLGEGLNLKLTAEGQSLATLSALAGTDLPALGPYRLAANAAKNGDTVSLTGLTATLGGSDIGGKLTLILAKRLRVTATLTSKLLDLKDFGVAEKPAAADAAKPQTQSSQGDDGRLFSADPLPLDGLRALDAEATVKAARLVADKLVLQDIDLALTLQGGRLKLHPATAALASGGRIRIDGVLDARDKAAALTAKVDGKAIDIGRLLKTLDATDMVAATLDLKADVTARGGSVRALMAGLNGRTELVSGEGRIASQYIELLSGDVLDALTKMGASGGDTKMNCFVSRFRIVKGVARSTALLFDTERMTIAGEGTAHLGNETLDLKLYPRPKNPQLINFASPFLVGGTFTSPSVLPDPAGMVQNFGQSLLGTAVGALNLVVPVGDRLSEKKDANPCVTALAQKPATQQASQPTTSSDANKSSESSSGGLGGAVEEAVKGLGDAIKSLFGK